MAYGDRINLLLKAACLWLLAAVTAQAFEEGPELPVAPPPRGGMDMGSWIVLMLACGGFVWFLILLKRKAEEQRIRDEMADARFEMEVVSGLQLSSGDMVFENMARSAALEKANAISPSYSGSGMTSEPPTPQKEPYVTPAEPLPSQAESPIAAPLQVSASDGQPERADITAAAALAQLRNSGLIVDIDGYAELHGNPTGSAVLKMKDGRRALLVPHFESEAFTKRNIKRFDVLIYVGRDGKAVVISSLENVIAEKLSRGFA